MNTKETGRLIRSKDVPAECNRFPRDRVRTREVKELVFNRFEYDVFRPYLRLNYSLRLPEKVIVEVRRTVNGEKVRIIYEPEGNNPVKISYFYLVS